MKLFDEKVSKAQLTKTQRRIAEYISENCSTVCFQRASDIADACQASPSSVVKFASAIGFNNFEDMKAQIRADIYMPQDDDHDAKSFLSKRLASSISDLKKNDPIRIYYEKTQKVMSNVLFRNEPDKFEKAKQLMIQADTIYVAGFSGSRGIADKFSIHLRRIFPRVVTLMHADSDALTRIVNILPQDCIILFSYKRYANMAYKMNQIAREFGAKMIVVTDEISAPVAEGADVVFVTETDNGTFFNSAVGPVIIYELLAFLVSLERGKDKNMQRRLDIIDRFASPDTLY